MASSESACSDAADHQEVPGDATSRIGWRLATQSAAPAATGRRGQRKAGAALTHRGLLVLSLAVCVYFAGSFSTCSAQPGDVPPVSAPGGTEKTIDLAALMQVYESLKAYQNAEYAANPIDSLASWDPATDPCDPQNVWFGIECTIPQPGYPPRIIGLNLEWCRLQGPIPTAIGNLNALTQLSVPGTQNHKYMASI